MQPGPMPSSSPTAAEARSDEESGAPPAKDEEVMGADTIQFMSVPLDILMKYFARAKRVTMQLPPVKKLGWLQGKDTEPAPQGSTSESPPSQFQMGQKVNGKAVAETMRDGTTLCPAFQQGNCKAKGASCPKGVHRCGVVTRRQRTCNSSKHGASACTEGPRGKPLGQHVFPPIPPEGDGEPPLFADLMSGPYAPFSQAFLFGGWRTTLQSLESLP